MSAPNIVNVTTINGKTAVQQVGTSASTLVSNSAASGKVVKVNALYVSNTDGTASTTVNISVLRSSTSYYLGKTLTVPADSTLDVITKALYLEEGDALQILAADANFIDAVCSYEEIS